ncbi:MAG: hypothetical protein IPL69_18100 [Saprospiraceae bacterium]|nr:hypothetical protein [Candidatus Brachybacter algidus]
MKIKLFFFFLLFAFRMSGIYGQLAIDVGYMGSTFSSNKFRPIIKAFNSYLPNSSKAMKKMNYMNGLHFSISSTQLPVNIYAEYNGTFVSLSGKRLINSSNNQYNYIFNYSDNAVGAGLLSGNANIVKVGASLLYNFVSIKQYTTDNSRRLLLKGDNYLSFKPYFDFRLGAEEDRVNASLRLFANIPLKKTDISGISTAMDPENRAGLDQSDLNQKLTTFGISFILHNKRY